MSRFQALPLGAAARLATGVQSSPWLLFAIPSLIWGSTFFAITLQLGTVEPAVSIVYRFALAAALMLAWCRAHRLPLRFAARDHCWFAGLGACTFGANYVLVYLAELRVTSGLVAMVFALMVFLNPAMSRVAFDTPVRPRLAVGAVLGVVGTVLLFWRDALAGSVSYAGIAMTLGSMLLSVFGNAIAERNHRARIPTASGIAWGMLYGTAGVAAYALASGLPWAFEPSARYVISLAYLAIVGSVVAFAAYFRLLERVGPGPAAYVSVVCPVIALALSSLLEGYRWTMPALAGVALILAGMLLALGVPGRDQRPSWDGGARRRCDP